MDHKTIQDIHRQTVDNLKTLLMSYTKIFSLGFSGGKDSSATAAALLKAMVELKDEGQKVPEVYVLYSDTLMELLPVQIHTYEVLDNIKEFALENGLPIKVIHAKPEMEDSMWAMQIAKGVRPSSSNNRWCTTRLKTDVQEKALFEAFGTEDIETISIVGSRKDESADRKKRLEDNTLDGHLKGHSIFSKSLVYAPIEDFSTESVWALLRTSEIGRKVLRAEALYDLYASTGGEGQECQTILGSANDSGKNPGCGASQGRFGCWSCPLQHSKDKALQGMAKQLNYINHLIEFRDWVVSIRDGNWHLRRDVYNHGKFDRYQYNLDNEDRFGMTTPGGMNLATRAEMLLRLLDAESKVRKEIDMELISDEVLDFCQHRWILEGDFSLTAVEIAKRYGREVHVTEEDMKLARYAKALYATQRIWKARLSVWYGIHPNERFAVQFVSQVVEKYGWERMQEYLMRIVDTEDPTLVAEWIKPLQIRKQFYPSEDYEKLIRREWEQDKVSAVTEALVRDYEETWDDESHKYFEDPLESPDISMEDKCAMLDNWQQFVGHDSNERCEHPEYMRFGGNYQYTTFRERQSDENRSKNKKKALKKIAALEQQAANRVQQSFDFAA